MKINMPKLIFTNEHLEPFSSVQIRIPNKVIPIPQVILQFWSFSSKFEKGDSNPSIGNSNPDFRKFKLGKAIRIQIPVRLLRLTDSNLQSRHLNPCFNLSTCSSWGIQITIWVIWSGGSLLHFFLNLGFESLDWRFESVNINNLTGIWIQIVSWGIRIAIWGIRITFFEFV